MSQVQVRDKLLAAQESPVSLGTYYTHTWRYGLPLLWSSPYNFMAEPETVCVCCGYESSVYTEFSEGVIRLNRCVSHSLG